MQEAYVGMKCRNLLQVALLNGAGPFDEPGKPPVDPDAPETIAQQTLNYVVGWVGDGEAWSLTVWCHLCARARADAFGGPRTWSAVGSGLIHASFACSLLKRVVLFFAFIRAKQPARIKEVGGPSAWLPPVCIASLCCLRTCELGDLCTHNSMCT